MFEEDRSVLVSVFGEVKDLRRDDRAIEANERLNETLQTEESLKAMNEMKDSAPGEDGSRLKCIYSACQEVQMRVIERVKMMFEKRAHK